MIGQPLKRLIGSSACLIVSVVVSNACGNVDTPLPPPPPGDGTLTVVALAYGRLTRGTSPAAGVLVKVFGSKDTCREPSPGTDVVAVGSDSTGWYRKPLQFIGTPGTACLQVRIYFDRAGVRDSLVIRNVFVQVKAAGAGVVPDSVRVDATLP